ncbi:MAG: ferritin-like domain-containing protein [Deltaproteobacteria bacterium]|nr:ferritin-like domain-containing protein [Deltaproteobacteria bacterium]
MATAWATPSWEPFAVENGVLLAPRSIVSKEGIGDRLRTAAFAEVQAEAAFLMAAERFAGSAPKELCEAWRALALEERKHRDWLVARMRELAVDPAGRPVSDVLWNSLVRCTTARDFCLYIAGAEERGRKAGERFRERMAEVDPVTADIFGRIATEEVAHIALARRFAPDPCKPTP